MRRDEVNELDAAIGHLRESRSEQRGRGGRRSGVVPISDQVLGVGRVTADAYHQLQEQVEAWQRDGSLIVEVPAEKIHDTAWRDRHPLGCADESFLTLCRSIASEGQIAPVALRLQGDGYEVVYGHRRVAACRSLGRPVRAVVVDTDVRGLVARMLIENAQRKDLSPIERAAQYRKLIDEQLMEREEIARLLGVTPQQVSNIVVLAELPEKVLDALGDARAISIATGKRLIQALRAHPDTWDRVLDAARGAKGDATDRANALIAAVESSSKASRGVAGRMIRTKDGRRFARLSASGRQIVLRFQPDLDVSALERMIAQLPELYALAVVERETDAA